MENKYLRVESYDKSMRSAPSCLLTDLDHPSNPQSSLQRRGCQGRPGTRSNFHSLSIWSDRGCFSLSLVGAASNDRAVIIFIASKYEIDKHYSCSRRRAHPLHLDGSRGGRGPAHEEQRAQRIE